MSHSVRRLKLGSRIRSVLPMDSARDCLIGAKLITLNLLMNQCDVLGNEIDYAVIQNANPVLTMKCLSSTGVKENKVFLDNLGSYGHMTGMDFLLNINNLMETKNPEKGCKILTFGSGWAGTYISSLITV